MRSKRNSNKGIVLLIPPPIKFQSIQQRSVRTLPKGRQPRAGRGDGVWTTGAGVRANVADPVTDAKAVKSVIEKFREKYGAGDVKKYYSKLDVAVVAEMG